MLIFAAVTLAITFITSRGQHSKLHHRLARIAMALELLTAAMALVSRQAAIAPAVLVAGCFLAVYFTDTRTEVSRFDYTMRILRTGWQALAGCCSPDLEVRPDRLRTALEDTP